MSQWIVHDQEKYLAIHTLFVLSQRLLLDEEGFYLNIIANQVMVVRYCLQLVKNYSWRALRGGGGVGLPTARVTLCQTGHRAQVVNPKL